MSKEIKTFEELVEDFKNSDKAKLRNKEKQKITHLELLMASLAPDYEKNKEKIDIVKKAIKECEDE